MSVAISRHSPGNRGANDGWAFTARTVCRCRRQANPTATGTETRVNALERFIRV